MWDPTHREDRTSKRAHRLATGVVLLAALGLCVSAASSQNQAPQKTKAFHATKDCSGIQRARRRLLHDTGPRTSRRLKAGSKIFYFQQASPTTLDSDIVIYVKRGTVATGHCLLHLASGIGLCTISDGTGTLAGFHLRVRVTADTSTQKLWHWDGTYSFGKG